MGKEQRLDRPIRRSEYTIVAASAAAQKGWRDLVATHRNLMVETWEFLTAHPLTRTPTNYPLKGELATVMRNGVGYPRWQHKPSQGASARIWFYVEGQKVYLERVSTSHPNETA